MKVLLVYAHPNTNQSFNAALRNAIVDEVNVLGHSIQISDLYADNFDPRGGINDFTHPIDSIHFNYQAEQTHAAETNTFQTDLAREQQKFLEADAVILQFPIWWGGPPAILKGWFDRVSAYGVTYVDGRRFETGLFKGRRSLVSVTTGGTPHRFSEEGYYGPIDGVLKPVQELFLGYLGFTITEPHVAYAVARSSEEELSKDIDSLREQVRTLLQAPYTPVIIPSSKELLASVGDRDWRYPG